jgi:hypothetical protein
MEEAAVRHILGPDGASALIDVIQGAWDDAIRRDGHWYHPSTRAADVWDAMARRGDVVFGQAEGVEIRMPSSNRPFYIMRDTFAVRLKMHDENGMTRNYPTKAQQELRQSSLLPDFDLPVVDAGYQLDPTGAEVRQCLITCPADEWIIDLDDLAAGQIAFINPIIEFPGMSPAWRSIPPIAIAKDQ